MPQIQDLQPSRVVRELISQSPGTYLIRAATDNDHLLSRLRIGAPLNPSDSVLPDVVLSVRVDDGHLSPIMNYHIVLSCSHDRDTNQNVLEQYEQHRGTTNEALLPSLTTELIVGNEECDWKIDAKCFGNSYTSFFPSAASPNPGQVKCRFPGRQVRVKMFKKTFDKNPRGFRHEFEILKDLCFFHVASFYGVIYESDQICHLLFAYHGRSLKERLPLGIGHGQSSITRLALIGYQIAFGMMYLERKHIVHRDLHAGNILEDDRYFIRIIDFEHAVVRNDHEPQSTAYNEVSNFQTRRLAPECLVSSLTSTTPMESFEEICRRFSLKSDVWAFALIFIELTLENEPHVYPNITSHPEHEHDELVQYLKIDRKIHTKPPKCPEVIYDILQRCWNYAPEDRLSFTDIRGQMFQLIKFPDP